MATPLVPQRSALVQQVTAILQRNIVSGAWPVGSRLPLEADLLAQYGVSRVTLRQAVQSLVHVGLLETIQGNGTFVRAVSEVNTVLARFVAGEELKNVLEARLAIEVQASAVAAEMATEEDLVALDGLLEKSREAAGRDDGDALAPLSAAFHQAVVDAAHNPVLSRIYRGIEEGIERSVREASAHQPLTSFVDEHDLVVAAIKDRDPAAAAAAARAHLEEVISGHARVSGAVAAVESRQT
ncbi:FadR/GntR family transcriptional regulator [Paenarthrobacter sp. NCHU4564]|uniref:FadR/GntR family transcriptional regulator n=1 Tax=Paenarthrobacter sp. NCHU4564 TaxID=3451353 RepID=UPI003F9DCE4B